MTSRFWGAWPTLEIESDDQAELMVAFVQRNGWLELSGGAPIHMSPAAHEWAGNRNFGSDMARLGSWLECVKPSGLWPHLGR